MTNAIRASSPGRANAILSSVMLLATGLKPISFRSTVGPALWRRKLIFFIKKEGSINYGAV